MAQISLRVDDDVKRGAEQALSDIGLSMSTAINVFLSGGSNTQRAGKQIVGWIRGLTLRPYGSGGIAHLRRCGLRMVISRCR